MALTEQQIQEHGRIFEEAAALIKDEIQLHDRPELPAPGWFLRRKLKRAIALFGRVLELKPDNWSAMWLVGKVYQRLGDPTYALSWFERAHQENPSQPNIAREASMCAMDAGRHDAAITFAKHAIQIEPHNVGLHANLALAYLVAARVTDAKASIERALADDPADKISQTIQAIVMHFVGNSRTPPATTPELLDYWRKNRRA
jgi:Flp pilus assembly protein TadD